MKTGLAANWSARLLPARNAWERLPAPQRRWLGTAAWLLVLLALWQFSLAPALATWRQSPEQHRLLDTQWQAMQAQVQALQVLQDLPRTDRSRATEALTQSLKPLGAQARLSMEGGRATVSLQGLPADALAGWLSSVRTDAQVVPVEADLQRRPGAALWDGRVVLAVPAP